MFCPNASATFDIGEGNDTFICLCQIAVSRVQVIDALGNIYASLGGAPGILPGQFRNPTSITCYVDEESRTCNVDDVVTPIWFTSKSDEEVMVELADEAPGTFYVNQAEDPNLFGLLFVSFRYQVMNTTIRRERSNDDTYVLNYDGEEYIGDSLISLLKKLKFLKNVVDPRPYAIVAVADGSNARVQLLKFYWTSSELFKAELKPLQIIGGSNKLFYPLIEPISVSFSPSGELGICDKAQKCVVILSKYFSLIKRISLPFYISGVTKKIEGPPSKSVSVSDEKNSKFMSKAINSQKQIYRADHNILSISFSVDGCLALGYRGGGVNILSSYVSYPMGLLESMQVICWYIYKILILVLFDSNGFLNLHLKDCRFC
jgi:hypothetical protein